MTQPFDTIEEHVGSVYRYALRLTGRPDLAEDLTQETLLRGWRNRQKLRDQRAARVWLFTNRDQFMDRPTATREFSARRHWTTNHPALALCQHAASDERENVRLALAAMDELPPRQRQVLYLVTCENLASRRSRNDLGNQ